MSDKPRCLLLVYELPWPPAAGGSLRDWQNISALAERTELLVIALHGRVPAPPVHLRVRLWTSLDDELLRAAAPFDGSETVLSDEWWLNELGYPTDNAWTPFRAAALRRLLKAQPFDFAVVEDVIFWRYAEIIREHGLVVIDYHNVQSRADEEYLAFLSEDDVREREHAMVAAQTMRHVERMYQSFPAIVCSEMEKAALAQRGFVSENIAVVHNTVDVQGGGEPEAYAFSTAAPRVLFAGMMNYIPNAYAALDLVREIFPRVRAAVPNAELWIVGMDPMSELLHAARTVPGVYVTGRVAETHPYFRSASVLTVPLRLGGGTRFKILEGFKYHLPVVSSPKGCEGLDVVHGRHLLVAQTASEHADCLIAVLQNNEVARRLASDATRLVAERYSFATAAQQWDDCLMRFGLVNLGTYPLRAE